MCGIAGFIDPAIADLESACNRMSQALRHRGPDDSGSWTDSRYGVALGHRRLSIVDLSPAGHQPMQSASGRYQMVFNGEIYNHLETSKALGGGIAWRGRSDTETLLAAMEAWGVETALQRSVGMFALAAWDRDRRCLILARDRVGEKPLFYGRLGKAFVFGSELKAVQSHPAFAAEVDRGALALFLRHGYVPDPLSIFSGIHKLLPGTVLEVGSDGNFGQPRAYWSASQSIAASRKRTFAGNDQAALNALDEIASQAVGLQMVADVPLGAFLSGGIDSSLIVALMQKQSAQPIRTFTIGFAEADYNEAGFAKAVANHLRTDHTELIVTPKEAMDVIPRLPVLYDEPFADSSQIPTFLVSQLARQHVTVCLSGDAGDELFGGYNRYSWAKRLWNAQSRLPAPIRKLAARAIHSRSPEWWTSALRHPQRLLPRRFKNVQAGHKLHKAAELLTSTPQDLYRGLVSHWPKPDQVVIGTNEPRSLLENLMAQPSDLSLEEDMMYWDLMTYLPSDILTKVDRAAMSVSLETRVPFLDHRVIEFAWSLPLHMRVRNGEGKWLLKQLLSRYVPRELTDRPKTGFGIPIEYWLRGPLRDWAESLLNEDRLRREGFFEPSQVREKWREHLSGGRNWVYWIWDVLMFQAWWQAQTAGGSSEAPQKALSSGAA